MFITIFVVEILFVGFFSIFVFDIVNSFVLLNEGVLLEYVVIIVIVRFVFNNGVIKYSIVGGNVGSIFRIEESFGIIRVVGEVNYEMIFDFYLWV